METKSQTLYPKPKLDTFPVGDFVSGDELYDKPNGLNVAVAPLLGLDPPFSMSPRPGENREPEA